MNELLDPGNTLFILGFAVQLISIPFIFFKDQRQSLFFSNTVLLIGLTLGLISTLSSALFSPNEISLHSIFNNFIRLDGLGTYFLFIIQLVAIPTTIYNFSYLQHYIKENKSIKSFLTFYIILLFSTQLIVIANHAILFLVSWEVMSMSAYLAMILEKEKDEVQKRKFLLFRCFTRYDFCFIHNVFFTSSTNRKLVF